MKVHVRAADGASVEVDIPPGAYRIFDGADANVLTDARTRQWIFTPDGHFDSEGPLVNPPAPISNARQQEMFIHCGLCLQERPRTISAMDWARLSVAHTQRGFQVWCERHNVNVMNIDFENYMHPANTTRAA